MSNAIKKLKNNITEDFEKEIVEKLNEYAKKELTYVMYESLNMKKESDNNEPFDDK